MASGFKNSAGTDLDDLFNTDNSNAGKLGYVNSANADLGNLYTAETKLNYAVGYLNSAGTDLGYLRGDNAAPVITSSSISYTQHQASGSRSVSGYFDIKYSLKNVASAGAKLELQAAFLIPGGYKNGYTFKWAWKQGKDNIWGATLSGNKGASPGVDSGRQSVMDINIAASGTSSIAFYINWWTNGNGSTEPAQKIVLFRRFYNSFGTTDWIRQELKVGS